MRLGVLVLAVTVWAGGAVVAAAPAASGQPPFAAGMVLGAADFPRGAAVVSERRGPAPSLPALRHSSAYTRSLGEVRVDGTTIASLVSSALALTQVSAASSFMSSLASGFASARARAGLIEVFNRRIVAALASSGIAILSSSLERARRLGVADEALEVVFVLHTRHANLEVGEIYVRRGAGLELVSYVAVGHLVPAAEDLSLARKAAAHIEAASAPPARPRSLPANDVAPSITGTLQPRGVVTADTGIWSGVGGQPLYSYQWLRCSSSGSACLPIAGASSRRLRVAPALAGRTLAVSVSVEAPSGQATAVSRPVRVVS